MAYSAKWAQYFFWVWESEDKTKKIIVHELMSDELSRPDSNTSSFNSLRGIILSDKIEHKIKNVSICVPGTEL